MPKQSSDESTDTAASAAAVPAELVSAPPAATQAGAPARRPRGFALAGLIVGVAGLCGFLIIVWGQMIALTGLIFAVIALEKREPRALALSGVIAGGLGVVGGLAYWITVLYTASVEPSAAAA